MKNAIRWMAKNHVAANMLMIILMGGGYFISRSVKQEVFPEMELSMIRITIAYPGASPEEVESGICLQVEEAVNGVHGVDAINATASEGMGVLILELMDDANTEQVLSDVKSEIDRITTFPLDIEEPVVAAIVNRSHVISLVVYGDMDERALAEITARIRDELLTLDEISQVSLSGIRPYEISIEISEENLRRYGLTLGQVAEAVRRSSRDLPAGSIKARGGEILIRTKEKKTIEHEYAGIALLSLPNGTTLKLGDIANIRDGFKESDEQAYFDGQPAAMVQVFRVGDQTPKGISNAVKNYIKIKSQELPSTIQLAIWNDRSEILEGRLQLLLKNSRIGLVLVLLILSLFLEIKLAFWVTMGIPISFLGAILMMPMLDVSINMITLFAFILCLGIVVDDAIVVGESVYKHRQMGKSGLQAALDGTMDVAGPVIFAILTTITVFVPMMYVAGRMGQIFKVIPMIVIPVLAISLLEALFILPAHLNQEKKKKASGSLFAHFENFRKKFDDRLETFINGSFSRGVGFALRNRYATIATAFAVLMLTAGLVAGGVVRFVFFPRIEGDEIKASLALPFGTPVEITDSYRQHMQRTAYALLQEYDATREDGNSNFKHVYSVGGGQTQSRRGHGGRPASSGSHLAEVAILLEPLGMRNFSANDFINKWRQDIGEIPGAESLTFRSDLMRSNVAIDIEIAHEDPAVLKEVSVRIQAALSEFPSVSDIEDNDEIGKRELQLRLKPEARALGITETELGRQIRAAFYGAEALRLQRGRNEVKVMVRYPETERKNRNNLDTMRIRTAGGGEIPFPQAATVAEGRSYGQINRKDRKRILNVTAEVDKAAVSPAEIIYQLKEKQFPQLAAEYPGLSFNLEGDEKDRMESLDSLFRGFLLSQLVVFSLLAAISFKSYMQPLLVMSAVPFGIFGSVMGHLIMGYNLSILSMLGMLALSGVVVNDSLILIDYVNRVRQQGYSVFDAILEGSKRRFRPIILTSLTTFFGIMPMIFETSIQARFLIPMAISLGFGVLFATVIILVLIPALYLIMEDFFKLFGYEDKVQGLMEVAPSSTT